MQSVKFSLQWTIATFGGFILSLLLVEVGEKPDIGVVQGALGGLIVALAQAFVLRERIQNPWLWVFSSFTASVLMITVGIGAVGWIVFTTQVLALRVIYGAILGAIAGFGMGLAHCLAIREHTPLAWQWILVSSVSWALGVAIGSAVGFFLHQFTQLFLGEVMGLAVTWLVVSILTGVNAYRILK
jgi:energy-converting hydrogenase Eha subunit A